MDIGCMRHCSIYRGINPSQVLLFEQLMSLCHRKSQRLRVRQLPLVRTDVANPDHQSTYRYEDNIVTPSHYWDNSHATTLKAAILHFM